MLRMPYDVTGKPGRQGNDEAEPEDLPNLVRRSAFLSGTPLHPAMDRTAGFFRVKMAAVLSGRLFLRAYTVICVIWGEWK